MVRGIGETEVLARAPESLVAVAGLVTQLGDMWFVLAAAAGLYVGASRQEGISDAPGRDCLTLVGLALGAYALTALLKSVFALPRPPGAAVAEYPAWLPAAGTVAYDSLVTADGYGFPSGHALKTTAVYGGGAVLLSVWDRRRRLAVAGTVTALVAASRVVLGVHYLVDVVVGVAVGAAFLAAVLAIARSDPPVAAADGASAASSPLRVFLIAALLGVAAFAASFSYRAGLAALAAGVGATVALLASRTGRLTAESS